MAPKKKFDGYLFAATRRKEIRALAHLRISNGIAFDLPSLVAALCEAIQSVPPRVVRGARPKRGLFPWPPLDVPTILFELSSVLRIPADDLPSEDEIVVAIEVAEASRRAGRNRVRADTLGKLLKLTSAERTVLSIRTIRSIDGSLEEQIAARKEAGRMYQQSKRDAARALKPKTVKPKKPWEVL